MNKSNNEEYDILIGIDDEWSVSVDDGRESEVYGYNCRCGSHAEHEHEDEI